MKIQSLIACQSVTPIPAGVDLCGCRHKGLTALFLVALSSLSLGEEKKTYPDAEGFGATVKGGAGGKVIWVTNLNSNGPGSLREAVDTTGPRIIKFKVAGEIELGREALKVGDPFRPSWENLRQEGKKSEEIENPYSYLTIDGETAPPPGITISGVVALERWSLEEIVIRYLRIRDNGFVSRLNSCCIQIYAGRVLIDHCSLQWARDDIIDCWFPTAQDITVQWCILGPSWGNHAFGWLNSNGTDRISVHHCLFAHNNRRNPAVVGNSWDRYIGKYNDTPTFDWRNNVIYNWHSNSTGRICCGAHVNFVGNLYLKGPDSGLQCPMLLVKTRSKNNPSELYLKGNISPKRARNDLDEWADVGYEKKTEQGWRFFFGPWEWGKRRETPFPAAPVNTHSVEQARQLVLSQAGAWPRDAVDAGIIRTVLHLTGRSGSKNTLPSDYANARPTAKAAAKPAGASPTALDFRGSGADKDG